MNLAIAWGLPFGSFFNWNISRSPFSVNGVEFWQTVRVTQDGVLPTREQIGEAIASNPGSVWIIGNEPDVVWQDNVTAERYAILYEEMYRFIKTLDSTARVAVGGVAMPTPLRREYLNRALESYRISFGNAMPVDVWTVHAYILREQSGSWGVEIPPGMDVSSGQLYEIADHGNLEIFRQNLIDFRAWMFSNGYGDRPLAVTEFGVLMPPDYGYPDEAKISFMNGAMDFMGSASNGTGYPADGGRLVQWWFWYSLYDTPDRYPAGNLIDHERNGLTALGQAWAAYVLGG
jgi:hypothetical protein